MTPAEKLDVVTAWRARPVPRDPRAIAVIAHQLGHPVAAVAAVIRLHGRNPEPLAQQVAEPAEGPRVRLTRAQAVAATEAALAATPNTVTAADILTHVGRNASSPSALFVLLARAGRTDLVDRLRRNANPLLPCGTRGAYRRHLRRQETPCDECAEANRRATKAARQRAREQRVAS